MINLSSRFFIATEYHSMMLYFNLPIICIYLPPDHFHHFVELITAIRILLGEPTHGEVPIAGILLKYFVIEMESIYGKLFALFDYRDCHNFSQRLIDLSCYRNLCHDHDNTQSLPFVTATAVHYGATPVEQLHDSLRKHDQGNWFSILWNKKYWRSRQLQEILQK